ncbi:hypothetical protein [Microbacterium sp. K41]|uniref:hypothetical protein n=1 Tax=Microbacterium sp. K41 TaxID=2305437 RepID=UPI00109D0488|nr:hypothetical protein [Microbacterium sp. K41]
MSAVLEANIARALVAAQEAEEQPWEPNRQVTLDQLRIVDMIHEGWPQCRVCGQAVRELDPFGLCSKTSVSHQERRGVPAARTKTGARS